MSPPDQIGRWMSLRAPQYESLNRLHAIVEAVDFKKTTLDEVSKAAISGAALEAVPAGGEADPPRVRLDPADQSRHGEMAAAPNGVSAMHVAADLKRRKKVKKEPGT